MTANPDVDFLRVIDAIVRTQPVPPGLSGRVILGVENAEQTRWWIGTLGRVAKTEFVDEMPHCDPWTDGLMILGEADATSVLYRGALPTGGAFAQGNIPLIREFFKRYGTRNSAISLRCRS